MKDRSGARSAGFRWTATCALGAAIVAVAPAASAQPKPPQATAVKKPAGPVEVQGTVLELDGEELVLDLGIDVGASENLVAELWRPLKLKHPVTGKVVADRFKIGQIQIGQVRPAMSLAKASGALARPAQPGDLVIFTRAAASSSVVAPASSPDVAKASKVTTPYDEGDADAKSPAAPVDVDAKNVTDMFEGLRGRDISTRITTYESFLRSHPDSRFAPVLYEEAAALRQLFVPARTASAASSAVANVRPAPSLVNGPGHMQAVPGQPVRVSVELNGAVEGAVLQVRRKGDTLFTPMPMKRSGVGYFAATIPAEHVSDRDLEYFVEAVWSEGAIALVGQPRAPETIDVEANPKANPPPTGAGSVSVLTDFADYNRARGNDYSWQTEGTFGLRFKDLGIRAVRMGFGVYRGVSGTIADLDEKELDPRSVGLTYGYVEGEFGIHRLFSLITRATVGLLDDGVSGGGQLFARIGNDRGTNLMLGGEFLGGIGLRSIVELQLNTFERFPIVLRSEVTNQPAGAAPSQSQLDKPDISQGESEVAGRGIVQLGWRPFPEFTIAVRGSFQGRNINHAGPGVGGFVGYTW